tara:strand:+ start:758 stop:1654 length:897 start_codon:yes stop_codon:yes gene_type:complete
MSTAEFSCPKCGENDKIILMGETFGHFEKKCRSCESIIELKFTKKKLTDINIKKETKKETIIKVPADYKIYDKEKIVEKKYGNRFWVNIISALILSASLMGLITGGGLYYAPDKFPDSDDIKIYIVVNNVTKPVDDAKIIIDNKEINQTYSGNGTYVIFLKPGKYTIKIDSDRHKTSVMEVYVPVQDPELSLIDYSSGLEGINRFTFELEEGSGTISEKENTYLKMLNWCPPLILLFSLIGIWGSWITYTLQSYKNAQIGALFSIMAMGFLIIGPLLGIIALFLLPKIKKKFTGHFKN